LSKVRGTREARVEDVNVIYQHKEETWKKNNKKGSQAT
jgi:hypothetical protein